MFSRSAAESDAPWVRYSSVSLEEIMRPCSVVAAAAEGGRKAKGGCGGRERADRIGRPVKDGRRRASAELKLPRHRLRPRLLLSHPKNPPDPIDA